MIRGVEVGSNEPGRTSQDSDGMAGRTTRLRQTQERLTRKLQEAIDATKQLLDRVPPSSRQ